MTLPAAVRILILVSLVSIPVISSAGPVLPVIPIPVSAQTGCGSHGVNMLAPQSGTFLARCGTTSFRGPYGSFVGSGSGYVALGQTTAVIFAAAKMRGFPDDPMGSFGGADAYGGGSALLVFEVAALAPPPAPVDSVPVVFWTSLEADLDGLGAGATAQVRLDGTTIFSRFLNWFTWEPYTEEIRTLGVTPSYLHVIQKALRCEAGVNLTTDPFASCSASLDPVLSFDQAAFDAQMGDATFDLEDYFEIHVQEELAGVPEPGDATLLGALLLGMWARRRSVRA